MQSPQAPKTELPKTELAKIPVGVSTNLPRSSRPKSRGQEVADPLAGLARRSIPGVIATEYTEEGARAILAEREQAKQRALAAAAEAERNRELAIGEASGIRKELERSRGELEQERLSRLAARKVSAVGIEHLETALHTAVGTADSLEQRRRREHFLYRITVSVAALVLVAWALLGLVSLLPDRPAVGPSHGPLAAAVRQIPATPSSAPYPEEPRPPAQAAARGSPEAPLPAFTAGEVAFEQLASDLARLSPEEANQALRAANVWLAARGMPPCSIMTTSGTPAVLVGPPHGASGPLEQALIRCASAMAQVGKAGSR